MAYICTEGQFPVNRLQQMIPHMPKEVKSYTDNLFIHHIPDMVDIKYI